MFYARLVTVIGNCQIRWNPSIDAWQVMFFHLDGYHSSRNFYTWKMVMLAVSEHNKENEQ